MIKKFLLGTILCVTSGVYSFGSSIVSVGDVDYIRLEPEVLALIAQANNNDKNAQIKLADNLLDGRGLKKDVPEAVKWFTELADKNNGYAAFALSVIYQYGIGIKEEPNLAAHFYKKGLKSPQIAINMHTLASHLNNPNSSFYNVSWAIDWFNKAADRGNLASLNDLAEIYLYGDNKVKNTVKALNYYGRAAARGSSYAKYSIGTIYYDGKGIKQDKKEAFKWLLKAATQGFAPAQYRLAEMYLSGDGVVRDDVEAYAWLSAANSSLLFDRALNKQKGIAKNLQSEDLQEAIDLAKQYNRKFVTEGSVA